MIFNKIRMICLGLGLIEGSQRTSKARYPPMECPASAKYWGLFSVSTTSGESKHESVLRAMQGDGWDFRKEIT